MQLTSAKYIGLVVRPAIVADWRPEFDSLARHIEGFKKLVITIFLLNVQHQRGSVEIKPVSSLVVSLSKALSEMSAPLGAYIHWRKVE